MRRKIVLYEKPLAYTLLALTLLSLIGGVIIPSVRGMEKLPLMSFANVLIDWAGIIIGIVILISCFFERTRNRKESNLFSLLIAADALNLFFDICCWCSNMLPDHVVANLLSNSAFYITGYIITLLFWVYMKTTMLKESDLIKKFTLFFNILTLVSILLIFLNIILGGIFWIDTTTGEYHRGSFFLICYLCPIIEFVIYTIVLFVQKFPWKRKIVLFSFIICPALAMLIQTLIYGLSVIYAGVMISILIIWSNYHVKRTLELDQVRAEIETQKLTNMMNQIQPHFIYNVLSSIYYLCDKDPKKAKSAINDFSQFLRFSIDSVDKTPLVSIKDEIKYIEKYLSLEKVRFDDELNYTFDICKDDFMVPRFSIQPLVENAVKHGVTQKEGGGTVKIIVQNCNEGHKIIVEDDGVGFSKEKGFSKDRDHVGLKNIEYRISALCEGTLTITSQEGVGTTCVVIIPAKEE